MRYGKPILNEPKLISEVIDEIKVPRLMLRRTAKKKVAAIEDRKRKARKTIRKTLKEKKARQDYSDLEGYIGGAEDKKIPKIIIKKMANQHADSYKWRQKDPTKRKDFPEFCRDFIGQNHGAIAQAMLELFISDKDKFLKYIMEMSKMGYPASMMKGEAVAAIENKGDIYATLTAMSSASGQLPEGTSYEEPEVEEADVIEDEDEPTYEIMNAVHTNDVSEAERANEAGVINITDQFLKLSNNEKRRDNEEAGDPGE